MKVIVFGAAGFVGQNVVKSLSNSGFDVTATDMSPMQICFRRMLSV